MSERPHALIMQVLHFDELSQEKTKALDPCLKYKEQETLADSPPEGRKGATKLLTPQVNHPYTPASCFYKQFMLAVLWC